MASERAIVAHVMLAQAEGADIHARERVLGWEPANGGVRVSTERAQYEAAKLMVSAGPWIGQFVPPLAEAADAGAPGARLVPAATSRRCSARIAFPSSTF